MRILAVLVISCALLSVGCNSDKSNYNAGIAAYERGHYTTALYDFDKRANQGDPVAQFCLGFMYKNGKGVRVNEEKAKEWYTKAAVQGYVPAQNNLAIMYYQQGREVPDKPTLQNEDPSKELEEIESNFSTAYQWFAKAVVEQNKPVAQYNLALIRYFQGTRLKVFAEMKDEILASYLKFPKEDQDQEWIESLMSTPDRAEEEYKKAVIWFTKAAENDYPHAQYQLADKYYYGEGVDKNLTKDKRWKKAVEWYTKAANQNDAKAQNSLGLRYYYGEGVDKDPTEAVKWYRKAANQGNATAQNNLAIMYYDGEGIDPNLTESERWKEAIKWYRKAAKRGNATAQNNLAIMYNRGEGVSKNLEMAARWYFRAAQQGNSIAQANLGLNFDQGLKNEILQDHKEAYYWYSLALKYPGRLDTAKRENFAEKVKAWQQNVENKLSEKQGEDILKHVDNWKSRNHSGSGTGFYINENYILTNAHVVTRDNDMKHKYDEFRIPYRRVELIAWDPEVDLALLYDERGNTDTTTFRNASVYREEKIVSFGYPKSHLLSYEGNSTPGIVSGLFGMIDDYGTLEDLHPDNYFQHTAPIQGGNSGGPVFDLMGNVVGVTTYAMKYAENVNFAIEFDVIKGFLEKNGFKEDSEDAIGKEKIYKVHYISTEDLRNSSNRGNISKKAEKFTVPVLCFKNKGEEPLPLVEIGIAELK